MDNQPRRIRLWVWFGLLFITPAGVLLSQTNMNDVLATAKQLDQVASQLSAFEKTSLLDQLEEAVKVMESVSPFGPNKDMVLARTRKRKAELWLGLLVVIDKNLDPNYDKNVVIQLNLVPPPDGGVRWPSGVDPKVINDPKARAEYEAALKANREKAERYNFQLGLHRIDTRVSMDVERFVQSSYAGSESDKKELDDILNRSTLSTARKQKLKRALTDVR